MFCDFSCNTSHREYGALAAQDGFAFGRRTTYALDQKGQMDYTHTHALLSDGQLGAEDLPVKRDWLYDQAGNRSAESRENYFQLILPVPFCLRRPVCVGIIARADPGDGAWRPHRASCRTWC